MSTTKAFFDSLSIGIIGIKVIAKVLRGRSPRGYTSRHSGLVTARLRARRSQRRDPTLPLDRPAAAYARRPAPGKKEAVRAEFRWPRMCRIAASDFSATGLGVGRAEAVNRGACTPRRRQISERYGLEEPKSRAARSIASSPTDARSHAKVRRSRSFSTRTTFSMTASVPVHPYSTCNYIQSLWQIQDNATGARRGI